MRYLGHVETAVDLHKLMNRESLEYVDTCSHGNGVDQVLRFVRYEPGARSGKFHHYVSVDMPIAEFQKASL